MEIRDIKRKLAYVLDDEQVKKFRIVEYRNLGVLGLPDGGLLGVRIKTKTKKLQRDSGIGFSVREELGAAVIHPGAAQIIAAQIADDEVVENYGDLDTTEALTQQMLDEMQNTPIEDIVEQLNGE